MTLLYLLLAALLETGGDAFIRAGMRLPGAARVGLFLCGALMLFNYGCLVNASQWGFGRLLGIYVAIFFVLAQLVGWIVFHEVPRPGVLLGGAFIVAGALIVAVTRV